MLIALLSDTHDNAAATRAALALLAPHQPAAYIHAGDLVEPDMLDLFADLPPESFHFVFGNNEFDHPALIARAAELQLHCHGRFADLTLAGKRIAVTHGHDPKVLEQSLFSHQYDYLIHGHTHVRRDERRGRTRIINPGALHRTRAKSVVLLDLATDTLRFLEIAA